MSLAVAAVVAAGMFALVWVPRRRYLEVPELAAGTPEESTPASVTVVIPARNEASRIAACIESLKPQAGEIVVADDASKDGTKERAEAAGAVVRTSPPRPSGVYGRPNASYAGAQDVRTKWVLFADADTAFQPDFLSAILARDESGKLDMISVFLRPRHPYTEALLAAVPGRARRQGTAHLRIEGQAPTVQVEAAGCAFAARCPYAQERCRRERPELRIGAGPQAVACHRADELTLFSPVGQAGESNDTAPQDPAIAS